MENVYDKVAAIVAEQLGITLDDITMDTTLEELNADSLDVVEVIMSLEKEFNMEIPDEEAEKIKTIGGLVEYVENNY